MRNTLLTTFMFIALLVLAIGPAPVSAQSGQPPAVPAANQGVEYLLLLNTPHLSALTEPSISAFARLVEQSARPVLTELESYQQAGIIGRVELRAQQNVISVEVLQEDKAGAIAQIPGVARFAPAGMLTGCVQASADALPELIRSVGSLTASPAQMEDSLSLLGTSAPTFKVFHIDNMPYAWIDGNTGTSASVHLTIKHGAETIVDTSFVSSDGTNGPVGYFEYNPMWIGCGNWTPASGDVIAVTANGLTTSTTLAPLSGWVDPTTGKVTGKTAANKKVQIDLTSNLRSCSPTFQTQTVTADSSGNFQATFTAFKGDAEALVSVLDGSAATAWNFEAPHLWVYLGNSDVYGTLHPNTGYTLTFTRQGAVDPAETLKGTTSYYGNFYESLSNTPAAGDSIKVVENTTTASVTLTYTYTSWGAVTLDATTASGTTPKGNFVRGVVSTSWPLSCSGGDQCAGMTVTNDTNAFTLTFSKGLTPGNYVEFTIYDSQGNYAIPAYYGGGADYYVPYLLADLSDQYFRGSWDVGGREITITHKQGGSAVDTIILNSNSDGGFYITFFHPIQPGDVFEVVDNVTSKTRTLTVPTFSAVLNNDTNKITGSDSATGKKVLAFYSHPSWTADVWTGTCKETTAAGGVYSIDLAPLDVTGQDTADVVFTSTEGYFSMFSIHALTINAITGDSWVTGYALAPNTAVTGKLYNGTTLLTQAASVATGASAFVLDFNTPLTPGLKVEVSNGGLTGSLTIPTLSGSVDFSKGTVAGKSPAGQPVRVGLALPDHHSDAQFLYITTADGSGNYSVKTGQVISNCYTLSGEVTSCAQAKVIYTQADGHRVEWNGPKPQPVRADAYEVNTGDNYRWNAYPYLGLSHHTFHDAADVDWISFQVTQAQVTAGTPITLETFPGPRMATTMRLVDSVEYDTIGYSDNYYSSGVSRLTFTPTIPGTYYVEIRPYGGYDATDCGAYYDFFIYTNQQFLPLIFR